jgi:hypothetical protein
VNFEYLNSSQLSHKFEDTKGDIRSRKPKKDRKYHGQKKKQTNNDLQKTTHENKARARRTLLKTTGENKCSGMASSS